MITSFLRCGKLRIQLLLCLLTYAISSSANLIIGRVVDSETNEPLEGAQLEVKENFGFGTIQTQTTTDSLGFFQYQTDFDSRITFNAKFFGYYEGTAYATGMAGNDTILIKDIKLKPSPLLLKEITVEAKKRKFYMRGDTVVFNPEAFQMEEGERLIELLGKLPGVTLKDGRLLWNGEALKLMMNDREVFNADMLMNRLPVHAVEDIKAYDEKSELEERTGVDDGERRHVLDVSIKPSFMDKMYGQTKAALYSSGNYCAEVDAMRLSDTDPMMLFGRVADEPGMVTSKTINTWGSENTGVPIEQQMGAVGYQHAENKKKRPNRWNISTSVDHHEESNSSWENTETFLTDATTTLSQTEKQSDRNTWQIPVKFNSYFKLSDNDNVQIGADIIYRQTRNQEHDDKELSQRRSTEDREDIGTRQVINTSTFSNFHESKNVNANGNVGLTHYFKTGSVNTGINFTYSHTQGRGNSLGEYKYHQPVLSTMTYPQDEDTRQSKSSGSWYAGMQHSIGKKIMTNASLSSSIQYGKHDEERHRGDSIDLGNSYHSKTRTWKNEASMGANITIGELSMKPSIRLSWQHERLAYQRARLDTVAHRNILIVSPEMTFIYKLMRRMNLGANLSYSTISPNLVECLDYRDDTNPLYIRMGNPLLKNSHTLRASMNYSMMLTRASQALNFTVNYQKQYNPVGMALRYHSQTGAYLSTQQNMRGGHTWTVSVNYDLSPCNIISMNHKISETWGHNYGLTTLVDEATNRTHSRQNSSQFNYDLTCNCSLQHWNVELINSLAWNRYAYSDANHSTQNIIHNETMLNISYKLAHWTFSLKPRLIINQGYAASSINGNQFPLHAEIQYKFLRNKANITLTANDMFNQLKRNYSSNSATTRTEGGSDFLHHYVAVTFTYKFDAKKDK